MKIKAITLAQGIRCSKGSTEETFIDVTIEKYKEYELNLDDRDRVTIFNSEENKTLMVFPTNIKSIELFKKEVNEFITKRNSKTITQ